MFVIEDANFLISILKSTDIFHTQAVETLKILSGIEIEYVYPEVVLKETIFVLLRNGYNSNIIRTRINELSMIPKIIIQNTELLTMLRYGSRYYKTISISADIESTSINSTNDFIIACTAIDYNTTVISNDQRLLKVIERAGINCC